MNVEVKDDMESKETSIILQSLSCEDTTEKNPSTSNPKSQETESDCQSSSPTTRIISSTNRNVEETQLSSSTPSGFRENKS